MAKNKALEIDMCAGSQLRDTQGEMLSVEGADIGELTKFNDNHGKGFFNSIGVVTSAKKIFKSEDCDNDRQRYYWDKIKAPYIYVRGFLHDDEDHPNARAAAAILRNLHKHDSPLQLKASVEGGVISRGISDPSLLARTKIHSIALTFTPANNATLVEPISLDKSSVNLEQDMQLIKSVMHLAQTDVPSFRHIYRDASATKVHANLNKIMGIIEQLGVDVKDAKVPSKEQIIEKSLETKIANNVQKINELIAKAREDAIASPTERAKYRKERRSFDKPDPLKGKVTTQPGVSTSGIEVRRGDARKPGAVAHGYARVSEPKFHMDRAKTSIKQRLGKDEDGLEKASLKSAALGAALSAASMAPGSAPADPVSPTSVQQRSTAKPPPEHAKAFQDMAKKNPILGAIGMIESSGGKNYGHRTIASEGNMHHGHTAGGMFGIMPHSAAFILSKKPELAAKYPKLAEAAKNIDTHHDKFTERFNSDPQASIDFASALLERNKTKTKNDNMLIHSWLNGVKGTWNKYKEHGPEAIENHPYVKKVLEHVGKFKEQKPEQNQASMKKAMMAGYGGGGAPTGQTGGAVLQSESLEDGRPGINYVTCDKCGKDQVHAKHQVKCRNCGENWSLEKLYNVMKGSRR